MMIGENKRMKTRLANIDLYIERKKKKVLLQKTKQLVSRSQKRNKDADLCV